MSFPKPTTEYWNRKLQAYLHDPFDKVFKIPTHESRASELLEILGLQADNESFWKEADIIASGIERGTVPGYQKTDSKSGAVDFFKDPIITHPTGTDYSLKFDIPVNSNDIIFDELKGALNRFIGKIAGDGGYSDLYKGDPDRFSIARFFYIHIVLRFKLSEMQNSKLGQLWHRIPADSRFPDHSIWNHNQLVSALNSCMDFKTKNFEGEFDKERKENIGMSVFSISPVQGFIGKSRKLRDYWASSIILSYLAFEGIRWVVENLGPDHILYPSLIDQPLIAEYLRKNWKLHKDIQPKLWEKHPKEIATFPNKFLFLTPINKQEEIVEGIRNHIRVEWRNISNIVRDFTKLKIYDNDLEYFDSIWERQNENFWEFSSASVKLTDLDNEEDLKELFNEKFISETIKTARIFKEISKKIYRNSHAPILYGISHTLVQSVLALEKSRKSIKRKPEPGEKCQLCGEYEVVHTVDYKNKSANEYAKHLKEVWNKINDESNEVDVKKNERLCSICTIKRFLPKAIKNSEHLLKNVFKNDSFPSTTELAISNAKNVNENNKKNIAKKLYNGKTIKGITDKDKYYAILIMDGDKMGDLINGKTIGASWNSIIHPKIKEKLKGTNKFNGEIIKGWKELFDKKIRNLIPSVHTSISESLGDFAIYGVAPIIEKYNGKLIYAGGDDVAAVMPLKNVLKTAKEIKDYYIQSFRSIGIDGSTDNKIKSNKLGKLSVGLGNSKGISISAGILICHHKEPLSQMISRAHLLLEKKAKEETGRNAFAIELKKRSGGSRYFAANWYDKDNKLDSFIEFGNYVKKEQAVSVSTSLIYRLNKFRSGIEAILQQKDRDLLLNKFLEKNLERSGSGVDIKSKKLSELIRTICVYVKDKKILFESERLIVAAFLSEGD
jgi:CRISPR-associated protein Cmr2